MKKQLDTLLNGNKIFQDSERFMFGIDAILLADFAANSIRKNHSVIDLGTGTGIIPLLLDKNSSTKNIVGLEIQSDSAKMACESVEINNLQEKIKIVEGDIKKVSQIFKIHSFDVVISNPPYMKVNSGKNNNFDAKSIARHEIFCNLEELIVSAEFLLKNHGSFFMIHRPERLSEIFYLCKKYKLEPKVMRFIVPFENKEPTMVLVESRKDAKPDLKVLKNLVVYKEKGVYTDEVLSIYRKKMQTEKI